MNLEQKGNKVLEKARTACPRQRGKFITIIQNKKCTKNVKFVGDKTIGNYENNREKRLYS